jgi:hypothetical protein
MAGVFTDQLRVRVNMDMKIVVARNTSKPLMTVQHSAGTVDCSVRHIATRAVPNEFRKQKLP